ncbi:MAG: triose-phosphate isomerase [Syntrophothermus sp.]
MRKPIIAGNWKMFKTVPEALDLVESLKPALAGEDKVEIVLCPPFTALYAIKEALQGANMALGAQDLFWEKQGAYTGEISPAMLLSIGCRYVIIGHSERRQYFGETDETVNKKVKAALAHSLLPIICVGESLEQREAGRTEELVRSQVVKALNDLEAAEAAKVVIAYEPIWAIGTGRNASGADANKVAGLIRRTIAGMFDAQLADGIRVQYGGSVKPENIAEFMRQPEIDGALVGGASLDAQSFARIVRYEQK